MSEEWLQTSELHGPAFVEPEPLKLVLFGAVELSAALCRLGTALGWRCFVVDPRERYAESDRFPGAAGVIVDWPEAAVDAFGGLDESTAVAALTHDPVLDDPALELALRSPAFYVGAMGSRRNQGRRRERLTERGLSDQELARLSGPAGLELGARTATETALSIAGEIVAVRHGRSGGRLVGAEGAIRSAAA